MLIHHLTNHVSMRFQANACIAVGDSPIMASAMEEVAEITAKADGLLINLGTPADLRYPAVFTALYAHPTSAIVLDPVGVGVSEKRRAACLEMLASGKVQVLKGNRGEIAALVGEEEWAHGVDSVEKVPTEKIVEQAIALAKKYRVVIVMTGAKDFIVDGKNDRQAFVEGGHPWLAEVSGSGCVLGTIITCFLAENPNYPFEQAKTAVEVYRLCAAEAAMKSQHFGEFPAYLISMLRSVGHDRK